MKNAVLIIFLPIACSVHAQDEFTKVLNTFSIEAYHDLRDSGNFFFSPLSVNIMLAMIKEGAGGETEKNLTTLLHHENIPEASTQYQKMINGLPFQKSDDYAQCIRILRDMGEETGDNQFNLYNALWYRNDLSLNSAFKEKITASYQTEEHSVDRSGMSAANAEIQEWIRRKTHDRIQSSGAGLNYENPLVLLNVVYFLAQWEYPFEKKKTEEKNFFTLRKSVSRKKFMNGEMSLFYYEDEKVQVVQLPYQCNTASMFLMVPLKRYGLPQFEEIFTDSLYSKILSGIHRETVVLSMPKFKMENELDVSSWLYNKKIFGKIDLSGMISGNNSWTPLIVHKTFIETDEEKTEASALTEMVITSGTGGQYKPPVPKVVNADHPFLFLIRNEASGQITFIGRLVN